MERTYISEENGSHCSKFLPSILSKPLLQLALGLKKIESFEKKSPPARKWSSHFYRWALTRPHKHISSIDPRLDLKPLADSSGRKEICWKGTTVGCTGSLAKIRNSAQGGCFIVATGPSLNAANLSLLSGRSIFGVNGAFPKLQQFGLSPAYYAVADIDFALNRFEILRQTAASGAKCFFSPKVISVICEREPALLRKIEIYLTEPVNKLYGVPRRNWDEFRLKENPELFFGHEANARSGRIGFSKNLANGVFTGSTIVYGSLQIAYHLGFRQLFILGMDLDYRGPTPRFYETEKQARPSQIAQLYEPVIRPSFELLAALCQQESLEVYNLSATSRLPAEIIPRTTLERAAGGLPESGLANSLCH